MRKLATLNQIENLTPIEGADRIELATIKGWNVIVRKGLHQVGSWVVFHEIDSAFPKGLEPYTKDLEARGSRLCQLENNEIVDAFVIRTMKMKGVYSQGYIVPINSYTKEQQIYLNKNLKTDYDVTKFLGVVKYEKPEKVGSVKKVPKTKLETIILRIKSYLSFKFPSLKKYFMFSTEFPHEFPKTECTRIQNIKQMMWYHYNNNTSFNITTKLDGSSISIYRIGKTNGVCSRNLNINIKKDLTNNFTKQGLIIHDKLKTVKENFVIQGEMVGPGIQDNFEGLNKLEVHLYSMFDIKKQEYLSPQQLKEFCELHGLKHVPVLHEDVTLIELFPNVKDQDELLSEILKYAEGPSSLNGKFREGVVFKQNKNGYQSIKAISNKYLLKRES